MTTTTDYTDTLRRMSYNGTIDATADHPALVLTTQAYLDSAPGKTWYAAYAISQDGISTDGTAPVWRVEWDITNPDAENEEDACDWATPRSVKRVGGKYDLRLEDDSV